MVIYDIKKMTILQFLGFLIINIIAVPIHLFLSIFIYLGNKIDELDTAFIQFIREISKKLGLFEFFIK